MCTKVYETIFRAFLFFLLGSLRGRWLCKHVQFSCSEFQVLILCINCIKIYYYFAKTQKRECHKRFMLIIQNVGYYVRHVVLVLCCIWQGVCIAHFWRWWLYILAFLAIQHQMEGMGFRVRSSWRMLWTYFHFSEIKI